MISLDVKAESKTSSPIGLAISNAKEEKSETLSFSELLKGVKDSQNGKNIQNGTLIVSLGAEGKDIKAFGDAKNSNKGANIQNGILTVDIGPKGDTLTSLLRGETKASENSSQVLPSKSNENKSLTVNDLLKGEIKALENSSQVLPSKSNENKSLTINDLLKGEKQTLKIDSEVLELNPHITNNLSITELKTLISDAKQFLKDKIIESDGFKRAEIKELPKTLKGLVDMAKKFDIDVKKISIEEVKTALKPVEPLKQTLSHGAVEADKPTQKGMNTAVVNNVEKDGVSEKVIKNTQVQDAQTDDVVEVKVKTQKNKVIVNNNEQDATVKLNSKEEAKETIRLDDKKIDTIKEIKATPLFKAQEKTVYTTEQLVLSKQFKVEEKTVTKVKADETLKLLLRGEKPSSDLGNMTKDFSVATAKVIAPTASTEISKSFEQLLRGNIDESASKLDGISTNKADAFEVKLNEAKQMIKYLSQDVKTAIEDYKAPFTRVKVQLSPQRMGEVDVTIVQRGKNLHVNISSNTAAINTLAINANELKVQLNNTGINNASLNFNNSSQNNEQQNASQQQNRQHERHANEEYKHFDTEEQNEEILSSLEIVVPHYA